MSEIKARFAQKHDVEVNWDKATNFIPKAGEIIVYDADSHLENGKHDYPRIKVGNGTDKVNDLPFANEQQLASITEDGLLSKEDKSYIVELQNQVTPGQYDVSIGRLHFYTDNLDPGAIEAGSGAVKIRSGGGVQTLYIGADSGNSDFTFEAATGTALQIQTEFGTTVDKTTIDTYVPVVIHAPGSAADQTPITIDGSGIYPGSTGIKNIGSLDTSFDTVYARTFNADSGAGEFIGDLRGMADTAAADAQGRNIVNTYATKEEVFITTDDIDTICGTTIEVATSEVKF